MARASSCWAMPANVVMSVTSVGGGAAGELVLQVEDLLQLQEAGVGSCVSEVLEEVGHLGLPASVNLGGRHACECVGQGRRLEVADEQSVVAQEERVVVPAGR